MKRLATFLSRGKALIAYVCVGDPSVDDSVAVARACVDAGADVLELGVPFSDPSADGPAIARASQRAIAAGGGLSATLRAARSIRDAEPDVGIVLFGYYNPIFVAGEGLVARQAGDAGVDAVLVVDLPVEESASLRAECAPLGVGVVPLLAPTTTAERVAEARRIAADGSAPFVYFLSVTGVTGTGAVDAKSAGEAGRRAAALRAELGVPVVVGFGIDSREKARAAAAHGSGVVVGSALVRAVEQGTNTADRCKRAADVISELRAGVDEA